MSGDDALRTLNTTGPLFSALEFREINPVRAIRQNNDGGPGVVGFPKRGLHDLTLGSRIASIHNEEVSVNRMLFPSIHYY